MVIILHGDDHDAILKRLTTFKKEARKRGWEIRHITYPKTINEQLRTRGLFSQNSIFILKDVEALSQKEIDLINKNINELGNTLVLYSERELDKKIIKKFGQKLKIE